MAGKKYEALVAVEWPTYDDKGEPTIHRLNPGESAEIPDTANPRELLKHHAITDKLGTYAKMQDAVAAAVAEADATSEAARTQARREAAEKAAREFLAE